MTTVDLSKRSSNFVALRALLKGKPMAERKQTAHALRAYGLHGLFLLMVAAIRDSIASDVNLRDSILADLNARDTKEGGK